MPGNKAIYNDAIKKGHNAAWDGEWMQAIAEYRRALAEFPDDVTAHVSLAHVLEEAGQFESALHECRIASKLQPQDPLPMTRLARLQEKLRRPAEAAGTYLAIAELYVARKTLSKAVEAWEKAAALEPDRTDVHQRLAEVYEQGAHHARAAKECVALARIYRKRGDRTKAQNAAQKALAIAPHDEVAQALIEELARGEAVGEEIAASPVDKAEQAALARLAETLLEEHPSEAKPVLSGAEGAAALEEGARAEGAPLSRSPERSEGAAEGPVLRTAEGPVLSRDEGLSRLEIDALIARAVNAQTQHRIADAIGAYRRLLKAGVARPEVKFNLGLLYLETMRYDDAIQLLSETVSDPNYALASHFALGQCFRAQGKIDEAAEHFLQVTRIVDLSSVRREQADELISVYEGLAESYAAKGDREQAESFIRALEEFLTSKGWEDKVREVRHHLEALREAGAQVSLAEVLSVPESDKVLEALAFSQEYLRRGKYRAASDECYRALELAPNYLPAHTRLAEIWAKEGRVEDAKMKYKTLAEVATVRGDLRRAEGFYRQVLKVSGGDVGDRSKLIDLLIQQGHTDAALEEYLELGNGYWRAGQFDQAVTQFGEGVRLAARTGIANTTVLTLRHRLAEGRAQQGDLKGALAAYQEIRQQSPEDERACVYAIDLQFRLGQTQAARRDLEGLLARYRQRGELQKAVGVLEGLLSFRKVALHTDQHDERNQESGLDDDVGGRTEC